MDKPKPVGGRWRWSRVILVSAAAAFLILMTLIVALCVLLIDGKPLPVKRKPPDPKALASVQSKIQKELLGVVSMSGAASKVSFKQSEANALLAMAFAMAGVMDASDPAVQALKRLDCHLTRNGFDLTFSQDLPFWTPFGSYLNLRTILTPSVADGLLAVNIQSLHVGSIPIPSIVSMAFLSPRGMDLSALKIDRKMAAVVECLSKLDVKEGRVEIIYDQRKLAAALAAGL